MRDKAQEMGPRNNTKFESVTRNWIERRHYPTLLNSVWQAFCIVHFQHTVSCEYLKHNRYAKTLLYDWMIESKYVVK